MKFTEYCASFITPQMTLLEKFNAICKFLLKWNPEIEPVPKAGEFIVDDLPTIADIENPTQAELEACFGRAFRYNNNNEDYVFIPSYSVTENVNDKICIYSRIAGQDDGVDGIELEFITIHYYNGNYVLEDYNYPLSELLEPYKKTKLYKHIVRVNYSGVFEEFELISSDKTPIKTNTFNERMSMFDLKNLKLIVTYNSHALTTSLLLSAEIYNDTLTVYNVYDGQVIETISLPQDWHVSDTSEEL